MSYKKAYWINPQGEVVDIGIETHISMVIKNHDYFGLTKYRIDQYYQKYGEKMWTEGKAREQIILRLLNSGFIRIRLYNKYWSVSAKEWESHCKHLLSKWAELARENRVVGKHMRVSISTFHGSIKDYTVEDLYLRRY